MIYTEPLNKIYKQLDSSKDGISSKEAAKRLITYGTNELSEKKRISPITIFVNQFKSFVVYILMAAVLISVFVGEALDAIVIAVILLFNGVFGFIQEYRAEKSIEALKKMSALRAKVIRSSQEHQIDSKLLVPGDIVLLEEGDKISADIRLIEVNNLETQEAPLTGESTPVSKDLRVFAMKTPIGDRKNMVFSGTIITKGRGKGLVVKTAMHTEIGKIAKLIQDTEVQQTPLQKKLQNLGQKLGIITIVICLIVFVLGYFRTGELLTSFITSVALAVAAIPEGLPAIVTVSLALGVQRMIKKNALIRKLPSVETLGSTTIICSDKTGTLTHNEMTVSKIYANNKEIIVSGVGYKPDGKFSENPKSISMLLKIGTLCNNAHIDGHEVIGDPTEGALIISAAKAKMNKAKLEQEFPRIHEYPFDSKRKLMTTIHKAGDFKWAYVKGAPDVLINKCDKIYLNGKVEKLSNAVRMEILHANEAMAKQALRVLGFGCKKVAGIVGSNECEKNLIFVGLQGMIDPPRMEVKEAISKCYTAGIKVAMITGDHKITALAVAEKLGIKGGAMTGDEIDKSRNLADDVKKVEIFARVSPEHKLKIVEAHRKNGEVIAMTGDGVNDAPALKDADIGVAMGITGTDVAKEASAMILTDDNFASIVNAVQEGRAIFDNIKKFVNYLLSSNFGEVLVLFIAMIIGFTFDGSPAIPLLAIQILWINLVTDGFPALALGVDPQSKGIMKRQPRKPDAGIVSKNMGLNILLIGILIAIGTLILFKIGLGDSLAKGQTMAFTALVVFEIARVYMIRSEYEIPVFSNGYLLLAITASLGLQVIVVFTSFGNNIFKTVPLNLIEMAYIGIAALMMLVIGLISAKFIVKLTKERD